MTPSEVCVRAVWLVLVVGCGTGDPGDTSIEPLLCPGGGVLAAQISEDTLPTCVDVEQRYADVVEAVAACHDVSQCHVVAGQCGTGLGGCWEAVDDCYSGGLLEELGQLFATHSEGCVAGVCDCAEAPPVDCIDGRCVLVDAR